MYENPLKLSVDHNKSSDSLLMEFILLLVPLASSLRCFLHHNMLVFLLVVTGKRKVCFMCALFKLVCIEFGHLPVLLYKNHVIQYIQVYTVHLALLRNEPHQKCKQCCGTWCYVIWCKLSAVLSKAHVYNGFLLYFDSWYKHSDGKRYKN